MKIHSHGPPRCEAGAANGKNRQRLYSQGDDHVSRGHICDTDARLTHPVWPRPQIGERLVRLSQVCDLKTVSESNCQDRRQKRYEWSNGTLTGLLKRPRVFKISRYFPHLGFFFKKRGKMINICLLSFCHLNTSHSLPKNWRHFIWSPL